MAYKKRKRRKTKSGKAERGKRKNRSLRAFFVTLTLTIAVGLLLMLAISGAGGETLVTYGKTMLENVIGGEKKETDLAQSVTAKASAQSQMMQESRDFSENQNLSGVGTQEADPDENLSETAAGQTEEAEDGETLAEKRLQQLYADGTFTSEDKVYIKEASSTEEVTLVFAGDILFDDNYAVMASLKQRGGAIESSISADMLEVMRGADIFMLNNEFPYSDRGEPTEDKTYTFRGRPEYASYLLDMGVDIVSLANNHASDYGTISLTDTIDVLNNLNMPFVGAGRNLEEATQTAYFVVNDITIAILSATQIERMENPATKGATDSSPGVFRCLNIDRLLEEIQEAKQKSDFVVVYIHWGTESTDEIDWAQQEQAPKIAEAGADLIIGDHPHVLQPIGYCDDVPVVYSLGNFLFNSRDQDTCLVKVTLNADGLESLQFIPGRQSNCSVTMHSGEEKERVLAYMREISPEVTIDAEGFVEKR